MTHTPAATNSAHRRNDPAPGARPGAGAPPSMDGQSEAGVPEWRPQDFAAVQECLTLLARAIRQFHTYPATSPLCVDAIAACRRALVGLDTRDHLLVRVMPNQLIVDDIPVGAGTAIEHEIARRLHRGQVATAEIARTATVRDLTRFCGDLSAFGDAARAPTTFAELLTEHGVTGVTVRTAHRPQVLDVGAPSEPVRRLVEHERRRRHSLFASGGPVQHLYPPDKGWVRVDPSTNYESFSLVDLAVLIDDPAQVAVALMRLTGDDSATAADPGAAFEDRFSDLATIFSAVDPRLARLLFSKLSRAVLELEPGRRVKLLRRTVLPGLLDGRLVGSVLTDFPDVDLAEALCLLLDLETASPEVLTTALGRLGLPAERRSALVPLLEERLQRSVPGSHTGSYGHDHAIERYARRLIAIAGEEARSFDEFTAFDLSVTDQTRTAVAGIVSAIGATPPETAQLEALLHLVRLEPNPAAVSAFMARTLVSFEALERQQPDRLTEWAVRFRRMAAALREARPDVADAVIAGLESFCSVSRAMALADLHRAEGGSRATAHAFIESFGETIVPSLVVALDDPALHANARSLGALMSAHAMTIAPALVARLPTAGPHARQAIVRVLGEAGAAYAPPVITLLKRDDEQTGREALRALARMGSAQAAAAVAAHLESRAAWARAAAEEALWHFPPPQAAAQVRALLADRDFVLRHPDTVTRLLDRAMQSRAAGLAPVLETLTPLRFRFWNPALVRVALKARQMLRS